MDAISSTVPPPNSLGAGVTVVMVVAARSDVVASRAAPSKRLFAKILVFNMALWSKNIEVYN